MKLHVPVVVEAMARHLGLTPSRMLATIVALAAASFAAGTSAGAAHAASDVSYPAKLKVLRAGVEGGRLDVLAEITKRADADRVRVSFIANGKRYRFTAPIEAGRIRFKRPLPASQRRVSTGIMEVHYGGNDRVRPTEVRLRAAKGKARLQRDLLSLDNGVITARGSLTSHARGVVRTILSYERPDSTVGEWQGRARIHDDGTWRLEENLPSEARAGGYLSIQFTGYHPRRIRGEQVAKQLLDGQSFGSEEPTSQEAPSATGPVHAVPGSVSSDCSVDVTSELVSWFGSVPDGSTLQFSQGGCYRIEGTLELRDRKLVIEGGGATFRSFDAPASNRAIWRMWDSDVTFRNLSIVGSYASGGTHDFDLQWAHAIDLRGGRGVVENVAMSDVSGDCVYFGLGAERSSGAVRDSSCRGTGRNAVSVTAADDVRVERVTTDRIGYIVFDVEPNTGTGFGSQRVVFDSNTIGSYYMKAYTIIGDAPVADQAFTNNRLVGASLRIGVVDRSHRPSGVTITGNTSDTPAPHNAMTLYGITDLTVTGNTVPLVNGTMAYVSKGCNVDVSGNAFPGGSLEVFTADPAC